MDQVPHFELNNSRYDSYVQQNRPIGTGLSPRNTQAPQWAPTSSQTLAAPYIGARVSLISNSEIRYEGTLVDIDTKESTLSLQNVRTLGTEGRPRNGPQIPPSPELYDYIVFRGSDIKDLQVLEQPLRQNLFQQYHRSFDDPAILSGGSSYTPFGGVSYGGTLYDSHAIGGTTFGSNQGIPSMMPQQGFHTQPQQQYPGVFSPFQQGPWGLVPTETTQDSLETDRKLNVPFERQTQGSIPLGSQPLERNETEPSKAPTPGVGGASRPRGWGPPPTKDLDPRLVKESANTESAELLKTSERQESISKVLANSKITNSGKSVANGVDSSERSYVRNQQRRNYDRGTDRSRGRPYYRASRGGRGRSRSQNSVTRDVQVEEFDVVAMNEKFEKVHLEEKSKVEQQVAGTERKYDKQVSFFDRLSSSTTEPKEEDGRFKSAEMRKLDVETFGRDSLSQRGGRGFGYSAHRYGGRNRSQYYDNNSGTSRPHNSGRVYRIRGST